MVRLKLKGNYELLVGRYLVNNEQYALFTDRRYEPETENLPVVGVSLEEAEKFCAEFGLELPDAASWQEFAAINLTTPYWWGNDESAVDLVAWYSQNSGGKRHPVGLLQPNIWGLYDVLGNVWEWTARYETTADARYADTAGPVSRANVCGGAYDRPRTDLLRVRPKSLDYKDAFTGFRCVKRV
jgi:formylglycine-generating enzyme required for sulfatase activity